jgi:hypothetical protein
MRLRKTVCTQAVLVGDHHQLVTGRDDALQGSHHARQQRQLLEAVDLLVGGLFDQAAIPVDE